MSKISFSIFTHIIFLFAMMPKRLMLGYCINHCEKNITNEGFHHKVCSPNWWVLGTMGTQKYPERTSLYQNPRPSCRPSIMKMYPWFLGALFWNTCLISLTKNKSEKNNLDQVITLPLYEESRVTELNLWHFPLNHIFLSCFYIQRRWNSKPLWSLLKKFNIKP